ncbi:MAG: hypothetical protein CMO66_00175 [Verrucomicrobiales bacterium]|nr:hypothetical protein [Verrucomicrobiales bacterium]|tara:strand:+ start:2020 stop:2793 length:774 start_codon:yes stop_codon:yes gene_type:complete
MNKRPKTSRRGGIFVMGMLLVGMLIAITLVESRRNLDLNRKNSDLTVQLQELQSDHEKMLGELKKERKLLKELQSGHGAGPLPVINQIQSFELLDQSGNKFTLENLNGKIWLADIIFTRCPGPCPAMTQSLADLQDDIPSDWPVHFVTLTTDPEYDTPQVLNSFADRFKADPSRWTFLTGDKEDITRLAVRDLKLVALAKEAENQVSPNDLFIHSERFVLVDGDGRLRASFEHGAPGLTGNILKSITKLHAEPKVSP